MFETEIEAAIKGIRVKAESLDGVIVRVCTLTLIREFDSLVAVGLGGDAKKALAALSGGGMVSCVLPIDRVLCDAHLVADGDAIDVGHLKGTKATGKAGVPDEDKPPRIELEFQFVFSDAAWAFLGRHVGATASLRLNRLQREMDLGASAQA